MSEKSTQKYISNSLYLALTSKYIFDTLKSMRYTFAQFKAEYPDDKACLEAVLENRYGNTCPRCGVIGVKFHPITGRKGFVCSECDKHIYPLAETIFRKSETSLWNWFYAIYLFSTAKNGVSAKELERHLGVSYKTAWRMAKQIRLLMQQDADMLSGTIEVDGTAFGGRAYWNKNYKENKTSVIGAVERHGIARAVVLPETASTVLPFIRNNVKGDSVVHTDESRVYHRVKREFKHEFVRHSEKEYVKEGVHTNTIEGFWGQMKRSINGTYHCVSPKYLQSYVNEFVFRYNYRDVAVCPLLLEQVGKLGRLSV